MRKKLFTLMTLLLTAVTGVWAADETLFLWQYDGSTTYGDKSNGEFAMTATTGIAKFVTYEGKQASKESLSYNAAVPTGDLKPSISYGLKLGNNGAHIKCSPAVGNFQPGDIIYICGYSPVRISTGKASPASTDDINNNGILASSLATGTSKSDYNIGTFVLPEDYTPGNAIYISRVPSTSIGVAAIKIVRPKDPATPTFDPAAGSIVTGTEITISSARATTIKWQWGSSAIASATDASWDTAEVYSDTNKPSAGSIGTTDNVLSVLASNSETSVVASATYTVTAPTTPITMAWTKMSDIVVTSGSVTAPTFSNSASLDVNSTNFTFEVTGTAGILTVSDGGVVTIDTSVKGEATVTATCVASGYSADAVSYTIRVADAAIKWNFKTISGTVDYYNLLADAAKNDAAGELWSGGPSFSNTASNTGGTLAANGKVLASAEGLTFTFNKADAFRYDTGNNRTWVNGGQTVTIKSLTKGQLVKVNFASSKASNSRGFDLTNLSETEWRSTSTTGADFTGVVSANGDVVMTTNGGVYLFTITVIDPVAITPSNTKTTYVTTQALDFTDVEGLKAYVATTSDASSVTLESVTAVPAGTPLVLKGTKDTEYKVPVVASASAPATNFLKAGPATIDAGDAEHTRYVLSGGVFKKIVTNGVVIPAGKAYLEIDESSLAPELSLNFNDENNDVVTGINSVDAQKHFLDGEFYNLAGQRVSVPSKGLYIVNGKKVIVK